MVKRIRTVRFWAYLTAGLCWLAHNHPVCAQNPNLHSHLPNLGEQTAYTIDYATDLSITAGLTAILIGTTAFRESRDYTRNCQLNTQGFCRTEQIYFLDKMALGNNSHAWSTVSDISALLSLTLPYGIIALDELVFTSAPAWEDALAHSIIVLQATVGATALSDTLKLAVSRPRPWQYDLHTYAEAPSHLAGFPAGHVVAGTAASAASAVMFWHLHPRSAWRFAVSALHLGLVGLNAWGRIGAGAHFPTDVLAGLGIGALIGGVLVPKLHKQRLSLSVDAGRLQDKNWYAAVRIELRR